MGQKVVAAGLSGAVTTVVLWILSYFYQVEVPGDVASAITTIIGVAIAYLVPHSDAEVLSAAQAKGLVKSLAFLMISIPMLSACALFDTGASVQDLQKQFITSCSSYSAALISLAGVKNRLDENQIAMVDASISVVEPLCKGPLPTSKAEGQAALSQVAAEAAKLAALAGESQ